MARSTLPQVPQKFLRLPDKAGPALSCYYCASHSTPRGCEFVERATVHQIQFQPQFHQLHILSNGLYGGVGLTISSGVKKPDTFISQGSTAVHKPYSLASSISSTSSHS